MNNEHTCNVQTAALDITYVRITFFILLLFILLAQTHVKQPQRKTQNTKHTDTVSYVIRAKISRAPAALASTERPYAAPSYSKCL
jgi:hypothetical protein